MNSTAHLLLAGLPIFAIAEFNGVQKKVQEQDQPTASLLNQSHAQVLEVLGPPKRISWRTGSIMRWVWGKGDSKRTTVTFLGPRVIHVDEIPTDMGLAKAANPIPSGGAYLGQPVEQLLQRMGNPDETKVYTPPSIGGVSNFPNRHNTHYIPPPQYNVLVYGESWIYLGEDLVVGLGERPVEKFNGPR